MFRMKFVLIGLVILFVSGSAVFATQNPVLDAYVKSVFKLIEESGVSSNRFEELQRIWADGELGDTLKELEAIKPGALTNFERSLLSLKVGELKFREFEGSFDKLLGAEDLYEGPPYLAQYIALLSPSDLGNELVDRYYHQFSSQGCTNISVDYVQLCCTYLISGDESGNKILKLVKEQGQSDAFADLLCMTLLFDYNIRKEIISAVGLYYNECILNTVDTTIMSSIIAFSGPYKAGVIGSKRRQLKSIAESIDRAEKNEGAVLKKDDSGCVESN